MSPAIIDVADHQSIRSAKSQASNMRRTTARPTDRPTDSRTDSSVGRSACPVPGRPRMCVGACTFNCWINKRLESHHFDHKSTRRLGLSHRPLLLNYIINVLGLAVQLGSTDTFLTAFHLSFLQQLTFRFARLTSQLSLLLMLNTWLLIFCLSLIFNLVILFAVKNNIYTGVACPYTCTGLEIKFGWFCLHNLVSFHFSEV